MKKCYDTCMEKETPCCNKECRLWIEFEKDLNCTIIAVEQNGEMTLRQTAERLDLSYVRVKQIQDTAIKKIEKNVKKRFL